MEPGDESASWRALDAVICRVVLAPLAPLVVPGERASGTRVESPTVGSPERGIRDQRWRNARSVGPAEGGPLRPPWEGGPTVSELVGALNQLAVDAGGEAAEVEAPLPVPAKHRGGRRRSWKKGGGRRPGGLSPRWVVRCQGVGADGGRCKRWSTDESPQVRGLFQLGFCPDHLDQRRSGGPGDR